MTDTIAKPSLDEIRNIFTDIAGKRDGYFENQGEIVGFLPNDFAWTIIMCGCNNYFIKTVTIN